MDPATAHSGSSPRETERPAGRRWLQSDEGWTPGEDAARLLAAIGIALGAVALKVVIVGVLGGELGLPQLPRRRGPRARGSRGCAAGRPPRSSARSPRRSCSRARPIAASPRTSCSTSACSSSTGRWSPSSRRACGARTCASAPPGPRAKPTSRRSTALHEAAERDRVALTTLQAVTASLAGARTPVEVGDAILDRGLVALGAAAGGVSRVTDDGSVGRGHRGARLPGLRARHDRGARPRVAPARRHRVGQGRVPPEPRLVAGPVPGQPAPPRAGVAGRRRDRGAADDRGVANAGGDRLPVRPRPGLRRRHARPGDPAGGPGRPGARPRARVGRRPAVTRGPRARPGTARVCSSGRAMSWAPGPTSARGSGPCPA